MPDGTLPRAAGPEAPSLASELRAYGQLAAPMVLSRIGVAALAFTDGVMLARAGADTLAVHGLSESLMGRVLEVGMVAATAGLALAAQARAGTVADALRVGTVWHNGLALATGLGAAALLFSAFGGPLLAALGQPPELVAPSALVIGLIGLSAWPALLGLVCGGLLETIGRARTVVVAMVLANLLNIALNQWLIFGGLGVPPLGAAGAAASTLVVRVLMAAGLLALLWQAGATADGRRFGLRQRFDRAAWRQGAEQRRRGAAAAATVGILALVSYGLPVMAGWLGAQALALVTALFLCLSPVMVLTWGLADAAGVRLAGALGAAGSAGRSIRRTGWRLSLPLGLVLLALAATVVTGFGPFARLVLGDEALASGVQALALLALPVVIGDAASILFGALSRSLGVLRGPLIAQTVTSLALLPLAAGLAFGLGWQLQGLLAAQGGLALLRAAWMARLFDRAARAHDHASRPAAQPFPHRPGQPSPGGSAPLASPSASREQSSP